MKLPKISLNISQNQKPAFKTRERGVLIFPTKKIKEIFESNLKKEEVLFQKSFIQVLNKLKELGQQLKIEEIANDFYVKNTKNAELIAKKGNKEFIGFVVEAIKKFIGKLQRMPEHFEEVNTSEFL